MPSPNLFQRGWRYVRSLFTNPYFWGGMALLLGIGIGVYVLVNNMLMPAYTRQDEAVAVPDVINEPIEQAVQSLRARDLDVERVVQRFNPRLPRDVVVDQSPPANTPVKPGRTIFLTINSGRQQMVKVPSLEGLSLREARNRLVALGLRLEVARPDSIPHPHPNTVTRQSPVPGDSLAEGSSVTLWYSTGLGSQWTNVPDVTGTTVAEAQQALAASRLRYVVIGAEEGEETATLVVRDQSRDPGTRVREGFEVRLYVGNAEEATLAEQ